MYLSTWTRSAKILLVVTGLVLLPSLTIPHTQGGGPGVLDTSFNGTGVASAHEANYGTIRGMAIQPDGRIVVGGYTSTGGGSLFAARFTTTGILDTTFGYTLNGTFESNLGPAAQVASIAIQNDGKILLAGHIAGDSFLVCRLDSDGNYDAFFTSGTYGGCATASIGTSADAFGVAVQGDGKIVLGGDAVVSGVVSFALARFNAGGSLDSSFGSSGIQTTTIGTEAAAYGVVIQADGKIVLGGYAIVGGVYRFAISRYTTSGSLDTSFNGGLGYVVAPFGTQALAYSLALQNDGKVVAAGYAVFGGVANFAVARYTTSGNLDTTFGSGTGVANTTIGPAAIAYSVAIQKNGKIVAVGKTDYCNCGLPYFALARFKPDGTMDSGFGSSGIQTTNLGDYDSAANGVAIQNDGRIVVAGNALLAYGYAYIFVVARYTGDSTDTATPAWPAGSALAAFPVNSSTVVLAWTPATDNVGVTTYKIYKGGVLIATLPATDYSYPVTGLAQSTPYVFRVQASDEANNTSTNGPSASITIPASVSPTIIQPSSIFTMTALIVSIGVLAVASKRARKPD